jgi:hypothetical protein
LARQIAPGKFFYRLYSAAILAVFILRQNGAADAVPQKDGDIATVILPLAASGPHFGGIEGEKQWLHGAPKSLYRPCPHETSPNGRTAVTVSVRTRRLRVGRFPAERYGWTWRSALVLSLP